MEEPHTYNIIIYNIIYTYYQIDELYLDLRFELLQQYCIEKNPLVSLAFNWIIYLIVRILVLKIF